MKRTIFLPILVSFISAVGIFVQYKFSKQKIHKTQEHSIIKQKVPQKVESTKHLKLS